MCRQKGFSQFYLHAQLRYANFYREYGFQPVGGNFGFSDYEYAEMVLSDTEPHAQPSKQIGINPMLLNRPENSPFSAGPLEHRSSVESSLHAN
ncbi:MAG: hypothetical protein GAK35_02961 [Herbaspirillum frisingense]|uniref:Uncharacterized protein n=1 Tax=Herbaspirillum frisingense TaxID=92645 RepID=A0A7V8JTB3_9BURK|nr:MAG: hypothetical protein GAK35_02961 [Herbaspirillum frisingense]